MVYNQYRQPRLTKGRIDGAAVGDHKGEDAS